MGEFFVRPPTEDVKALEIPHQIPIVWHGLRQEAVELANGRIRRRPTFCHRTGTAQTCREPTSRKRQPPPDQGCKPDSRLSANISRSRTMEIRSLVTAVQKSEEDGCKRRWIMVVGDRSKKIVKRRFLGIEPSPRLQLRVQMKVSTTVLFCN